MKQLAALQQNMASSKPSSQMSSQKLVTSSSNMSIDSIKTNATNISRATTSKVKRDERKMKTKSKSFYKTEWNFLSFDYVAIEPNAKTRPQRLSSFSIHDQEELLMKDILMVLNGIEGSYIRLRESSGSQNKNVLVIEEGADKLLETLARRIINVCPMYSNVIHFIDDNDCGLVNQALAAAMRGVIKDYFTLTAQLELHFKRNNLTLQKMWFYLQPFFTNMEILKHLSSTIQSNKLRGGAVLSLLHDKTVSYSGNIKAYEFCQQITRDACVPYFEIFERWVTKGVILDPFEEFCIEDGSKRDTTNLQMSDDNCWEKRYRMNIGKLPNFLTRYQEKILKTGKYLSVVRECGKEIVDHLSFELEYTTEERIYCDRIDIAYQMASRQLLQLLINDSDLVGHLKSVKHYFFMDQGDFIVQFLDIADDELSKDVDDTNPIRLTSLLELALRTSIMKSEPHHEEVRIELQTESLLTQMSKVCSQGENVENEDKILRGFEAVTLTYEVKWPLSLILSHHNIAKYQMLFRHLFFCKYVERKLACVWKENQIVKRYALKAVTGYSEAFSLTQKMLNFVQNLSFFMMVEVIEPAYNVFINKVESHSLSSIDELAKEHTYFVEGCLDGCLLSQKNTTQLTITLLQYCISFAEFMQDNYQHSSMYELQKPLDLKPCSKGNPITEEKLNNDGQIMDFEDEVKLYHDQFTVTLLGLLEEITMQQQNHFSENVLHILHRLDFNEFYARERDECERSLRS